MIYFRLADEGIGELPISAVAAFYLKSPLDGYEI